MASQMRDTINVIMSQLLASGYFDRVNSVEPKSAPGQGFEAAVVWVGSDPFSAGSGLARAAMVYRLLIRVYRNWLAEPSESIDPDLLEIADKVLNDLIGDFDLGATARNVDIFGASGAGLSTKTGHVEVSGTMFRAIDILVPIIVNDAFTEAA